MSEPDHAKFFEAYIKEIITLTFGFTPTVQIDFPTKGMVQVTLDGTPVQRSQLMGNDSLNFQNIKMLLRIFARRNGYFSKLYVKPEYDEYGNPTRSLTGYSE